MARISRSKVKRRDAESFRSQHTLAGVRMTLARTSAGYFTC